MKRLVLALVLVLMPTASAALNEADPNGDGKRHTRADRRAFELLTRDPKDWVSEGRRHYVRNAIIAGRLIVERRFGWTQENGEWPCLYRLWAGESGWYWLHYGGIPQFRPASKGSPGFARDPLVQIRDGGRYIVRNYGKPSGTGCDPGY